MTLHEERYTLVAPKGVSLATSHFGVDAEFRNLVIEQMERSTWSSYVTAANLNPEARLVELLDLPIPHEQLAVHRGAESALRAHLSLWRASRLWVPELSYPGYRRVASYTGTELATYSDVEDLHGVGQKDLVVVADPGMPLYVGELEEVTTAARKRTDMVVIDATFSTLTASRLTRYVAAAMDAGCSLILSASKSLALAALRLAVIYVPPPNSISRVGTEWDVFQCAAIDVLLSGEMLCGRASQVHNFQSGLLESLVSALHSQGVRPHLPHNELAIVVDDGNPSTERYGPKGWKTYPSHGLVRLDVSEQMLARVASWPTS